jgi:predicted GNAT family N-acyltransferase
MVYKNDNVRITEIKYHSEEYYQEQELRDLVLRKPLGMSLYDENMEAEQHDVHIGAFINDTLAGVLILTRINATEVKMRQVAVDEASRGRNIGTELVLFAEEYSKKNGFSTMLLNARKTAVGFYEKMGYEKIGEEFLEINIPHFKMQKCL